MSAKTWRTPAVILFCAAVVLSLNMGVRQTFGLFLEPMTQSLSIGFGTFALAIAVQNLLWGLLTPFFGMAADRYGTARVLVLGGLLYVVGILVMALGHSVFALQLGAGVLVGMAVSACGFPMVLAAVARSVWPVVASGSGTLPAGQVFNMSSHNRSMYSMMATTARDVLPVCARLARPTTASGVATSSRGRSPARER